MGNRNGRTPSSSTGRVEQGFKNPKGHWTRDRVTSVHSATTERDKKRFEETNRRRAQLGKLFDDFDQDGNGIIDREELYELVTMATRHVSLAAPDEQVVAKDTKLLMEAMDANKNSIVDKDEFITYWVRELMVQRTPDEFDEAINNLMTILYKKVIDIRAIEQDPTKDKMLKAGSKWLANSGLVKDLGWKGKTALDPNLPQKWVVVNMAGGVNDLVGIRKAPHADGPDAAERTGYAVQYRAEITSRSQQKINGTLWVELSDGSGWLFEYKNGKQMLMKVNERPDDDPPSLFTTPTTDTPLETGRYKIEVEGTSVEEGFHLQSKRVGRLHEGAVVDIIEIQEISTRIRGMVDTPRGWISLRNTETNDMWAIPLRSVRYGVPGTMFLGPRASFKQVPLRSPPPSPTNRLSEAADRRGKLLLVRQKKLKRKSGGKRTLPRKLITANRTGSFDQAVAEASERAISLLKTRKRGRSLSAGDVHPNEAGEVLTPGKMKAPTTRSSSDPADLSTSTAERNTAGGAADDDETLMTTRRRRTHDSSKPRAPPDLGRQRRTRNSSKPRAPPNWKELLCETKEESKDDRVAKERPLLS